jgi:FtsH-binding integral membrane protein
MTSSSTTAARLERSATNALLGQTMGLVALTAGLFALGAYLGQNSSGGWAWLWYIAAFVALFAISFTVERSEQLAIGLLFAVGLLLGLAVAPTIGDYIGSDPQAVYEAGGATALFLAGFGAAGYATRRDLTAVARYSFWALLGLIAFGLVLVFVQIPGGELIYSVAGLLIFAGLILFDFQRLRQNSDIRTAPVLAASIFLDALNVFLFFLSIFNND